MQEPTAADAVWRTLEDEGIRVVFGHPGGAILPIYDALHRHGGVRHVLTRHEQGAAHAADGYARVTGRVGVCLATSGPGATNLVTGLATAQMDSVPILAITGQVPLKVMGSQAFQETDIVSVARPVTKGAWLVDDPDDIAHILRKALRVARTGRPGPVLVDVPKCVQKARLRDLDLGGRGMDGGGRGFDAGVRGVRGVRGGVRRGGTGGTTEVGRPESGGDVEDARTRGGIVGDLERVTALLTRARRPVLMVGRGVILSDTSSRVMELAELLDLPVVTTLLGLDAFPSRDPRALGMPGMHGTERANQAIHHADLIVGLGLRFDDRVIGDPARFAPEAAIVHFDIDPDAPGRTVEVDAAVVGDLCRTLPALVSRVDDADGADRRSRSEWWDRIQSWSRECGHDPRDDRPGEDRSGEVCSGREQPSEARSGEERCSRRAPEQTTAGKADRDESGASGNLRTPDLSGRRAARALCRRIEADEAIVVTDVGQHQMWMAQELRGAPPRSHLTSGGLGTMGYALPAALGASLGRPDRSVWMVAGDGGFQMTLQELATIRDEGCPIRMVVVNNGFLGMVRQWQELFHGGRYAATRLAGPDFVALGRAYGIPGRVASTPDELDEALEWTGTTAGPLLLEVRVRQEENVYPMVPTGAALGEMVLGPKVASEPPSSTGESGEELSHVGRETALRTGTECGAGARI